MIERTLPPVPELTAESAAGLANIDTLVLASTPLHVFEACAAINAGAWGRSAILIIDQKAAPGRLAQAVCAQPVAHLASVLWMPALGKAPVRKLQNRRAWLGRLRQLAGACTPERLVVGNDRRLEFHALMWRWRQAGRVVCGAYLDDGSYTYTGPYLLTRRAESATRWLERLATRLIIGPGIERPDVAGGSDHVSEAWVLFPQWVGEVLQRKRVHALKADWARALTTHPAFGLDARLREQIAQTDVVFTLPRDLFLKPGTPARQAFNDAITDALARRRRVAVKRHPRSTGWSLDVPQSGVLDLPVDLPFELLCAAMRDGALVGALTTALLGARWLLPDADICAWSDDTAVGAAMARVYQNLGIRVQPWPAGPAAE